MIQRIKESTLRKVENYQVTETVYPVDDEKHDAVAGVYITESRLDIVIGQIDDSKKRDKSLKVLNVRTPNTLNYEGRKRIAKSLHRGPQELPQQFIIRGVREIIDNSQRFNLRWVSIACFGPFQSLSNPPERPNRTTKYGKLGLVPYYVGWAELPIYNIVVREFRKRKLSTRVRIYTDVDASAFGEYWYRYHRRLLPQAKDERFNVLYLKFSKSISGGFVRKGRIWRQPEHPSFSVVVPRRYTDTINGKPVRDEFKGNCPYHGDCIEGLIGAEAISERHGLPFEDIRYNALDCRIIAYYVAQLCIMSTAILMPASIVIGGRVVGENRDYNQAVKILGLVRGYFHQYLHTEDKKKLGNTISPNYEHLHNIKTFITLPVRSSDVERGAMPGRHGALRLAAQNYFDQIEVNNHAGTTR